MKQVLHVVDGKNIRLDYESALGDSFLLMDEWAQTNLNEAELALYHSDVESPEKQELFKRWTSDQQITSLVTYIDDVLQPDPDAS